MEEKSFIEIPILATIILTFISVGIISYGVAGYYKISQLMEQAEQLAKQELYVEAAATLERAQKEWLVKSLKINEPQIGNLIYKNKKLEEDRLNYNEGLKEFDNGNWERAATMLNRIAGNSFYYENARIKIAEVKIKIPGWEPPSEKSDQSSASPLPSPPPAPVSTGPTTPAPGPAPAPSPAPAPAPTAPASSTPPAPVPAVHTIPPVISNVSTTNITASSVTISWNTDEPASFKIEYATSGNFNPAQNYSGNELHTGYSIKIGSLTKDTTYYYRIIAKDDSGNQATSSNYNFKTSAFGSLSLILDSSSPPSATIIAGTSSVEFLKIKLSATEEEDIRIDKINLTIFPASQCTSLFELIRIYNADDVLIGSGSLVWGGLINIDFDPLLVIPAGEFKVLTIKANLAYSTAGCPTVYKMGVSYNQTDAPWSFDYANRYNVSAIGMNSVKKMYVAASQPLYGNEITVYGKPFFNYSSASNPRNTPGKGEVLRINTLGGNRSFSVYRMTFELNLTDILNSGWNTCASGKLEPSDFSLYPFGGSAMGNWSLLNSTGAPCTNGEVVQYAQADFSNQSLFMIGINSDNDYILEADTSGATSGDTVKFNIPADAFSSTKYLTWSWFDDSATANGYGLKNFPIYGQTINY